MKKLLQNRQVLLLWISRSFSRFGDALEMLALLYLVYDLTGSGLAMGSLMLFSVLPNVIVSPFAGVIADRYNKNRIMFIAELVRTICIAVIPVLMITKLISLWQISLISIIVSVAESFFEPTAGTTFVLVVGREDMPLFNSVVTVSNHIARIAGYSLSGIMIATVGKEAIFVMDSITFLVSAIVALIVTIPPSDKVTKDKSSGFWEELTGGFKYVINNKLIITILFVIVAIQFLETPLSTYIPLLIDKVLMISTAWSGYFSSAAIAGAILGNILYPILSKTAFRLYHLYLSGLALLGLTLAVSTFVINPFFYIFLFFIEGLVLSLIGVWSFTEIQVLVDTAFLGRIFSIITMITLASAPLSGVFFGGLADIIYIPTIFKYIAVFCIIAAILSYVLTKLIYKTVGNGLKPGIVNET